MNRGEQTTSKKQILRLAIQLGSNIEERSCQNLDDGERDRGGGNGGFENLKTKRIFQSGKVVK